MAVRGESDCWYYGCQLHHSIGIHRGCEHARKQSEEFWNDRRGIRNWFHYRPGSGRTSSRSRHSRTFLRRGNSLSSQLTLRLLHSPGIIVEGKQESISLEASESVWVTA